MPESKDLVAQVHVQLSNFSFVFHKTNRKKMVRFRYSFTCDHPKYGRLGEMFDGCLLTTTPKGEVVWSPPKGGFSYQNVVVTPDTYKLVLDLLEGSGYTKHVGLSLEDLRYREMSRTSPQDAHPDLPTELNMSLEEPPLDPAA